MARCNHYSGKYRDKAGRRCKNPATARRRSGDYRVPVCDQHRRGPVCGSWAERSTASATEGGEPMLRRTLIALIAAALLGLTGCQQAPRPEPPAPPDPGPADHPTEVTYFWLREACQHIRTLDHAVAAIETQAPGDAALQRVARELREQREDQVAAYNLYIVKFGGSHPEHAGLPAKIGPTVTPFRCGRHDS